MTKKKSISILIGIIAFVLMVWFDQFTKKLIITNLKGHDPIILIPGVFQLRYLENQGAAFGILQGQRGAFIIITLIILVVLAYVYVRIPNTKRFQLLHVIIAMIAAGAVGNFIDRFLNAFVVDFFYFNLINFPIFNVADCYVTGAVIALIIVVLFSYKDDDIKELTNSLRLKKKES